MLCNYLNRCVGNSIEYTRCIFFPKKINKRHVELHYNIKGGNNLKMFFFQMFYNKT